MSKLSDFNIPAALALADSILAAPAAWPWIERYPGRGTLVQRFALPLELCESQNRTYDAPEWLGPAQRRKAYRLMTLQARVLRYRAPLQGRPFLRCIRFSSSPSDPYSDWAKLAVDRLCCPRGRARSERLGLIVDDSPRHIEMRQWCEKAPPNRGAALIEVWSGDEAAALPAPPKRKRGRAA